jgi:hypothetical protein
MELSSHHIHFFISYAVAFIAFGLIAMLPILLFALLPFVSKDRRE